MSVIGKSFFVTGGAGFIGSNMVERLLKDGASVIVYDNLSSGNLDFLKEFEGNADFQFVKADLLDAHSLDNAMSSDRVDAVIHLAANPDVMKGIKETDLDLKQGTIATYNVLEAARRNSIKEILFSSSSVVYGIPEVLPTPEDYGPLKPISLYGASKLASEGLITAFSHLFGMRYYIYRFANVVGKNATHGIVLDLARKLSKSRKEVEVLGNGKQKKAYVEVGDCVDAMLYAYDKSKNEENIFNITSPDQISVKEIAELVVKRFQKDAKIEYTGTAQGWPGDIPITFLSNKKLLDLGWKTRYTSKEAVKLTVDLVYEMFYGSSSQE